MAEEGAAMVEASVVVAAILQVAVAISAVAISAGSVGVVLVAMALRNTEEGISSTEINFGMEIVSGTVAISFLEVPFCMITPTTGMTIRTTGIIIRTCTTDIRTTDMRTTAFGLRLLRWLSVFEISGPRARVSVLGMFGPFQRGRYRTKLRRL